MKKERTALLYNALAERILVLDGAMGTMIQTFNVGENDFKGEKFASHPALLKGNNDVLNISRPDIIKKIQSMYFEAGADIVESNTFSANIISQREYGLEEYVYDIAFAGAEIAAETAAENVRYLVFPIWATIAGAWTRLSTLIVPSAFSSV